LWLWGDVVGGPIHTKHEVIMWKITRFICRETFCSTQQWQTNTVQFHCCWLHLCITWKQPVFEH